MRRKQSRQRRDQRREQTETKAQQRREQSERADRDETHRGSAGRVESRAAAKTKRVSKETQSDRENTSNDSLKLELVRRAFLYRESATAVVVLLVESDLQEHASGRRKRRTSSASSAAHSSIT